MQDNKQDNKLNNIEDPFEKNSEKKYNRTELMKLTGKELAKIAEPFSKFKHTTLSGMGKPALCDIILGLKKEDEKKPKARSTSSKSESEVMIDLALDTLLKIKKVREGDQAVINPIAHELFKTTAVSKVDNMRANNSLSNDKFNTAIFIASSAAIFVDTIVGFDKVPGLFKKIQNRIKKKNEADSK